MNTARGPGDHRIEVLPDRLVRPDHLVLTGKVEVVYYISHDIDRTCEVRAGIRVPLVFREEVQVPGEGCDIVADIVAGHPG